MTVMPDGVGSYPSMPEGRLGYEAEMDRLHVARTRLLMASDRFLDRPNGRRHSELEISTTAYTDYFEATLSSIATDSTLIDDRENLMAGLFIAEDKNIVSAYNGFAGVTICKYSEQTIEVCATNIASIFDEYNGDIDKTVAHLKRQFVYDFDYDKRRLISFAEKRMKFRRIHIVHVAGAVAIDVSKFALGTAIGIWAMRRSQR